MNDLFEDLADGRVLIRLLEIISGEKIGIAGRTYYLSIMWSYAIILS